MDTFFPQRKRTTIQRTPIKFRGSPAYKKHKQRSHKRRTFVKDHVPRVIVENDSTVKTSPGKGVVCGVCFVADEFLPDVKSMKCATCCMSAHVECYEIDSEAQSWNCDPCLAKQKSGSGHVDLSCMFCPFGPEAGAMKVVTNVSRTGRSRGEFVHVSCAMFGNFNKVDDLGRAVISSADVSYALKKCTICNQTSTGCVQCNYDGDELCESWFHAVCAMSSGIECELRNKEVNYAGYGVNPHKKNFYRLLARQGRVAAPPQERRGSRGTGTLSEIRRNVEPLIRCSEHSIKECDPFLTTEDLFKRKLSDLVLDPLKVTGDPDSCGVCFWADDTRENQLLICENPRCDTLVHQWCYGIQEIPEGPFLCDACSADERSTSKCVVCPQRGGVLKQVSCNRSSHWVHVGCAISHPEFSINNVATMTDIRTTVKGLNSLKKSGYQKCFCCERKTSGSVIQCSDCDKNYHPLCALSQSLTFYFILNSPQEHPNATTPTSDCSLIPVLKCCHQGEDFDSSRRWKFVISRDRVNQLLSPIRPMIESAFIDTRKARRTSSVFEVRRQLDFEDIVDFCPDDRDWCDKLRDECTVNLDRRDCKNVFQCLEQVCLAKGGDSLSTFLEFVKGCSLFNQEADFNEIYRQISKLFDPNVIRRIHKQAYTVLLDKDGKRSLFWSTQMMETKGKCTRKRCGRGSMFVSICHSCGSPAQQVDYFVEQYLQKPKRKKKKKGKAKSKAPKLAISAGSSSSLAGLCEDAIIRSLEYIRLIYSTASKSAVKFHGGDVCFLLKNVCLKAKKGSRIQQKALSVTTEILKKYYKIVPSIKKKDPASKLLGFVEAFHCHDQISKLSSPQKQKFQKQIRENLATQAGKDILWFDPQQTRPSLTQENCCSKCGILIKGEPGLSKKCYRCKREINQTVDFDKVTDGMIWMSVFEDIGVPFKSRDTSSNLADIMKFLRQLRPYKSLARLGTWQYKRQCYFITHMIFIAANGQNRNCWSDIRLDPCLFVEEFLFLLASVKCCMVDLKDPELVGELLQCLRVFGVSEDNCVMQIGVRYLLDEESRGCKGAFVPSNNTFYTRYHAAYCGIIGLAHEGIFSFDPKLEMCEKWNDMKDILTWCE